MPFVVVVVFYAAYNINGFLRNEYKCERVSTKEKNERAKDKKRERERVKRGRVGNSY